uniref:Arrestin-like N-terminal domain-containing protein n=1 Tax=Ditylenchus dipsaci TaxID=166011 RepID=A0A915EQZ1_9BILA
MVQASNSTVAHQADDVFERFEIEFDAGQDPVFHGGELITGCLKFKGRACWLAHDTKEGWSRRRSTLTRTLSSRKTSSYESPQAFVRYYARATFQTDEVEPTQYLVKKAFSIIAPPDLHDLLPPQSEPATKTEVVSFGGCCCRGKFTAEVTLPKSAYAPERMSLETSLSTIDTPNTLLIRWKGQQHHQTTIGQPQSTALQKVEQGRCGQHQVIPERQHVFFLSIPAVHTSTTSIKDSEPFSPELIASLAPGDQVSKLLESPSTATLKQRKQPFIRVEYALQVSLGANVLIEVPITIHPIPIYANGIAFRPFAAGAQPIAESDEADKKLFHGPFTFAPQYPVYLESPKPMDGMVSRQTVEISELPDGSKIVHTKEEYVVASQYSTTTQQQHTSNQPDAEEAQNEVKVQVETMHHNEFVPAPVDQTQPSNVTELEGTDHTTIHSNGVMSNGHQNGDQHVVEHHETDEQLTNGHLHTTTEVIEDGPDSKTKRVIEDLSMRMKMA